MDASIWAEKIPMRTFLTLQAADVASTLVFLSLGMAESNPVAGLFMGLFGPLGGLILLKLVALSIALWCGLPSHPVFLKRINGFYAVVIMMNYLTICNAMRT